jgi:hypothetical protein
MFPMLWAPAVNEVLPCFFYQLTGLTTAQPSPAFRTPSGILKANGLDFASLLAPAVAAEDGDDYEEQDGVSEFDEDYPLHLADDIDWEYPLPPPPDPFDEVDNVPLTPPPPCKKIRRTPSFDDVVAAAVPPHKGPHRQRPAKPKSDAAKARLKKGSKKRKEAKRAAERGTPAAIVRRFVHGAEPLATSLETAALPVARGAYGAKVEQPGEKWGSKKRRSLAELIRLGFRLVPWNGMCVYWPNPFLFTSSWKQRSLPPRRQ